MKVLYYDWNEVTGRDCRECMVALGWTVTVVKYNLPDYEHDNVFEEHMHHLLMDGYDCIFSFNFYPILSSIAKKNGIRYVSWVFDSPQFTLECDVVANECNAIFVFDRKLCEQYQNRGMATIHYMPLAYHATRLSRFLEGKVREYQHEITFLGSLYDDSHNLWDQIAYLPEEDRGYVEGLIACQRLVYGIDFCDELMTKERCERIRKYVIMDLPDTFSDCRDALLRNMIHRKMTITERKNLLTDIGEKYLLDVYSDKVPDGFPVNFRGYADYMTQMPEIFISSKINLNITLRSILSGIPLRVIDILGAGGFVLSNYQPELEEYFTYGEDIVWFDCPDDLMEKIEYFLKHDELREQIAQKGHDTASHIFTYERILPKMFTEVFGRVV